MVLPQCLQCRHFPWATGADLSMLPAVKCHPDMPARRFTEEAAGLEWECRYFARNSEAEPEESGETVTEPPVVEEQGAPAGEVPGHLDPEFLTEMKINDLRKLAAQMGLAVPARAKKQDLVELISAEQVTAEGGAEALEEGAPEGEEQDAGPEEAEEAEDRE